MMNVTLPKDATHRSRVAIALIAMIVTVSQPALAQRELKDIPDPDPQKELAALKVAEGFEINLFAAEPMVRNPIHMNFDSQGRLWVAGSPIYPHIEPGKPADDKVYVLEDTDGDGVADKSTIFADGLLIPTAVLPGDGGVYVANSTEMLHLKDTDGDGVADERRIVLSGFGTEDTHHILHTFRWGPDGMMYFNQSIYIHSHIETPWGPRRLLGGGLWQFRPESMRLEVFVRGFVNSWGHIFDRWGQSFATDGAYGEGINYIFPGSTHVTAVGANRIVAGLSPGQPKHCSLEVLSGRHLPDDWSGTMIANDFRGNRINRFSLTEDGSGYAARQHGDVVWTNHVAFRPVDVKIGPDGAIYICDWYNPIIQHGEVDFRDARRDHQHGRIWRVTAKDRPLVPRPVIVGATIEQLLDHLKSPEDWTRHHAKIELKQRGADAVLEPLGKWVASLGDDEAAEHQRLEALWVYQGLDRPNPALLVRLLESKDHRARAAAVRVLSAWIDRVPDAMQWLATAIADEHPRVRLEAVNAVRQTPSAEAADIAMRALNKPLDRWLDFALWNTVRELEPYWLPQLQAGKSVFEGDVKRLTFALKAVGNPAVLQPLVAMIRDGRIAEADRGEVYDIIAALGGEAELRIIFDRAMNSDVPAGERVKMLDALAAAALQRQAKPAGDLATLAGLLAGGNDNVRAAAARLAGIWKLEPTRPVLLELASGKEMPDRVRAASIEGLAHLGGDASRATFLELSQPDKPAPLRMMSVVGLTMVDLPAAANRAVEVLSGLTESNDPGSVFDAFLSRKEGPDALAAAMKGKSLPNAVAVIGLRRISTAGRSAPQLAEALKQAGGVQQMTQKLDSQQLAQLAEEIAAHGDAARGEAIYRRKDLTCATCHAIGGAGGQVAPDLVSIGASAPVDYLIESMLEPNAKIKEGYHVLSVQKTDDTVVAGILVRKTDSDLLLRDATDNEVVVPLSAIKSQTPIPVSLMPPGLTANLRRDEFVDLIKFMSQLGKEGDYKIGNARLVRRWRVMNGGPEADHRLRQTSIAVAAVDDPALTWSPAYSTVAGDLPLSDMPVLNRFGGKQFSFARFELDVTTAGKVLLQFNTSEGLTMWVGDKVVNLAGGAPLTLDKGRHTVTIAVNRQQRDKPLRVELLDANGSSAQAQIVGGK